MLRASVPDNATIPLPAWKKISELSYSLPPLVAPDKRKRSKGRRKKRRYEAGKGSRYSQTLSQASSSQSDSLYDDSPNSQSIPSQRLNQCSLCGEVGHNKVRCTASINHMGQTLTSGQMQQRLNGGHLIIEIYSVRGGTKLPLSKSEFKAMQEASPFSTKPFKALWEEKNPNASLDDVSTMEAADSGDN